jgi:hypothetical protein
MRRFWYVWCFFFLFPSLSGCEKEVNIKLDTGAQKIVVDGFIENGQPPFVVLTKSIGYFSTIDLSTLENSFVHSAKVTVSDGLRSIVLREYSLDTGIKLNKFFLYSVDTSDPNAVFFRGEFEKQYTLTIDYQGQHFESRTKIPSVKAPDTVWFRSTNKPGITGAVRMYVQFTDPDTPGNFVRYFTRRNSQIFYTGPQSVYDDAIINGNTIDSLTVFAGYDKARVPNLDSVGLFFRGDTVTLRWCAIERNVYDFYNTFEYATGTVGNPFASPVNVKSNINGGALGVWAGYGTTYITHIIP